MRDEKNFSVLKVQKEDSIGKPSYSRFTKTNDFKGVPHPLSGDYSPKPQEEIDDSIEGSCRNTSEHSLWTESESLDEPNEMSKSRLEVTNEKDMSAPKSKEVEPSCVSHIKTPRQPLKDNETHKVNRKNWNDMMERDLEEGNKINWEGILKNSMVGSVTFGGSKGYISGNRKNKSQENDAVAPSQPSSSSPPVASTSSPPKRISNNQAEQWKPIVKLVKKVKKLEGLLKRRHMVVSDSEEEEPESDASGEEQVEDISPNTLEAAKTLSKVASLKPRSIDKGRRYKRRKEAKGKKVVSSLDFQEEVGYCEQVSAVGAKKSTSSLDDKGQRKGKAPMISEETPKKSKEQILQEEASLAEAIRLDSLQKEEEAKQIHLDSLLAQRIAEEEELNEQQKKRKAQVQFEAQHYTNEDWDLIRAKIEANAELSKSMLGSELQGEDFAKKMVDLVNQRKKYFAEERARAKRNKPMTQSQLKTYMMNYLKNQGTWKLSQLKNLSFEEVKKEFDKLVKQVESFAPINFEATKASLKRFGEELQTKTPKRLKDDEAKDDEPTKKSGKRRKQMARKGLHKDLDKDDSEDSDEVGEQEESVTGTKIPINPVPVAMKTPSIATYKIIKQGEKGVYQIVREDGTDIVYINFGAMLKDISRDDLTELYRIVMNRYGMDGPEDELEKVFWKYLKNMFEEPLSTDPIWSELGQQRIISWRYYDACRVHCLNLESMDIYMLIERTYPLSAEMCKAMLDKKLQGGKPDENCYKMLKMMEKQAGIRK
ncbi:hypothetical protein Tco_0214198 [Tanacetum coccineum]